jgi:DNA-binding transcriptional MerR regulator
MPATQYEPTFNLKVVVQETGLKPDTLRAWERRYGLPEPQRTAGGHRLYSQRDIDTLKWLVARQQEGMSISRAVELWNRLNEQDQDPLHSPEYSPVQPVEAIISSPVGDVLENLRREWVVACESFNESKAEQILNQAFALYRVETVCLELILKGLAEIGDRWYEGEISVQQEHFASELAMRRIESLLTASPAPTRAERILLACPPGEVHTFAPLLLNLFLRRRGWDVLYLGANVPLARLKATINSVKPTLVILTAQLVTTAANLLEMSRLLASMGIPLAYGGRIFNRIPELRPRIPGYYLGDQIDEAIPNLERWLAGPLQPVTADKPVSEAYHQALSHFREKQSLIEADVWQALREVNLPPNCLNDNNEYLAYGIGAALTLGDLNYLNADVTWGEGLLSNYSLPPDMLNQYLEIYYEAAKTHLDERGEPIITWLAQFKNGSQAEE